MNVQKTTQDEIQPTCHIYKILPLTRPLSLLTSLQHFRHELVAPGP